MADALSRLQLTEKDFSKEAFAFGGQEFPKHYPLSFSQIEHEQQRYPALLEKLAESNSKYKTEVMQYSDKKYNLITKEGKIVLPPSLQRKAVDWYHEHLLHPEEIRMELTMGQYYYFKGM